MSLVQVGRLGRAHGVRGEIGLDRVSLTAEELSAVGDFVWEGPRGARRELRLAAVRPADARFLIRFEGVEDRDQAVALAGGALLADRSRLPDPGPGVLYTFQLMGLKVVDGTGRELGVIGDVLRTGANPVYVVRGERELLIPAIGSVVRQVDLEQGVVTVDLPPGLEDL